MVKSGKRTQTIYKLKWNELNHSRRTQVFSQYTIVFSFNQGSELLPPFFVGLLSGSFILPHYPGITEAYAPHPNLLHFVLLAS